MAEEGLAAGLPDASEASFIPIAAVIGALICSAIARLRRLERDRVRRWTEDGAFAGGLVGAIGYVVSLAAGV